jgi:hypothetical protein
MVKSIYIQAFSFVMAIMVFLSAIGLTINAHYCHTTGAIKKSVLPIVELRCADENDSASCAIAHQQTENSPMACCESSSSGNAAHDDDCCEDYTTFLKLLSAFDLPAIKVGFNLFIQMMVAVLDFLTPSGVKDSGSMSALVDPPPVFYGKQLLLAFHQLKIPSPAL